MKTFWKFYAASLGIVFGIGTALALGAAIGLGLLFYFGYM
jgi:hypothetical protein